MPEKITIETVLAAVTDLSAEMLKGFNQINARLDRLDKRLEALHEKVDDQGPFNP